MKIRFGDPSQVLAMAADRIEENLTEHPQACLALGANEDCLCLYRELAARFLAGSHALREARFFAVTEYDGLGADDPHSCRSRLRAALLDAVDPLGERSVFLTAENEADYDARIAEAGGLDLAILGVGQRGRVGFNEPGTPFDAQTHRQKLTRATKRELAALFGGEEQVPEYGFTMGIRTLIEAKEILLIALGEDKADPVFRMLYARTDSFVPAAFLQLPPEVTLYADEEAASRR